MAEDGKVVIKITGNDDELEKELRQIERDAKSAASKLAGEFRKAGMDQSTAMTKAWAQIREAQNNGTKVMIGGVETIIRESKRAATSISSIADAGERQFDELGDDAERAGSRVERVFRGIRQSAASMATGIGSASHSIITGLKRIAPTAASISKGFGIATGAISAAWNVAGVALVGYNGNLEQLQTSFETMTGSASEGLRTLSSVRSMAADTPFELPGLAATTQLLMNYNFTADQALNRMTMLGDISQGNQDKMTRIATAYGQMHSAQKVQLEDIKQMIEAGYNPLVEISQTTGESMESLYKRISKGTMAVDEITASMQRSTSAGGKYYQSMAKQAQTLNGQLSTLKDNALQLGGNLFSAYTNGMRDTAIPMANQIVEDINAAFAQGGADGLIDAVQRQLPRIGDAVLDAFMDGVKGVQKRAPQIMRGLVDMLPGAISGAGDLTVSLGGVLFDLAAAGIEGLFAHSGELADTLLDLGWDILGMAANGIFDMVIGLGRGVGTALKKAGVLGWSSDELMDMLFDGYDPERVAALKAKVKIDPDVTVESGNVELTSVYDMIEKALTDGEGDTPEVIDALKDKVTGYYDAQIEAVNAWRDEALAALDTSLPVDEYNKAVQEIEANTSAMVAQLKKASDQTVEFIDVNAGKSTESVRNNLQQLQEIHDAALGLKNDIAAMTGEALTLSEKQRQVVASGQSRDPEMQLAAIGTTAMEYQAALQAAEDQKREALEKALEVFEADSDAYAKEEARIFAERDAKVAEAEQKYLANMQDVWGGIIRASAPEQEQALRKAAAVPQSKELAEQLLGVLGIALRDLDASTDAGAYVDWFDAMLGGMNLTDVDYANLAAALGIDEIDPGKIRAELVHQLSEAAAGKGVNSAIGVALQDLISLPEGSMQIAFMQLAEGLPTEVKNVVQASVENGWLMIADGINLAEPTGLIAAMAGTLPEAEGRSIAQPFMNGYISGLEAGEKRAVATARRIAQSTVTAFRSVLQIRSPSRVMHRIGEYTGIGYDEGLQLRLKTAVSNAQRIVGDMNLAPKITLPELSGAFGSAISGVGSYLQWPTMLFSVGGRALAEATVRDNSRAIATRNTSIAMGVGRWRG